MWYVCAIILLIPFSVSAEEFYPVLLNGKTIFKIQKLSSSKCEDLASRIAIGASRMAQEEFDNCMANNPMGKVTETNRPQMTDICLISYDGNFKLAHKIVIQEKLKKEGCESEVSQ